MRFNGIENKSGSRFFSQGMSLVLAFSMGAIQGCASATRAQRSGSATTASSSNDNSVPYGKELGIHLPMRQELLSNGLRLIMVEDHTVPVVSYQTWFNVGSVDERLGYTGMAHLFEHLMFKGTPRYPEKQFFLELEAKGAEVNAYTTHDYTVFYENMVPQLLEKAIDMESDRLAHLALTEEMVDSEKMVVLEERRLRTDNTPEGKMQEAIWRLAFHYHPYQWPVIGYPEDLVRIRLADLQSFFSEHYQPANASIVVVGDFNADQVYAWVQKYYGAIPRNSHPVRELPVEPEQNEERRLIIHDEIEGERFVQAYHVGSAKDDDSYALDVLSNILLEGTNSRAYRKLVEETETALGVSGTNYTPAYPGLFMISGSLARGKKVADAEKILDQLIRQVQDQGVSADEVKTAVRQLTVQMVDGVRTSYGLGSLIGTVQAILGDANEFGSDLKKYLKVTPQDVQRVALKYLQPNNRSVVTLVSKAKSGGGEK